MKKIIYAFASLLALTAFASCNKDDDKGGDNTGHDATFKVVLLEAEGTSASVAVSSTSKSDADTWYCFCSTDIKSSLADLVSAEVAKLGGNVASALKFGNKTVSFSDLTPNTEYRVVVTGLLADGTVYGTPVEHKFNSGKEFGAVERNNNWVVTFGRGQLGDRNWTIADFVSVEVKGGEDPFFTVLVGEDMIPDLNDEVAVGEFLDQCVAEMQGYLDEQGASWSDILVDRSFDDPYYTREAGEELRAFAIGADVKGRKTGLWNCSDKIVIAPVTGSEDFKKYEGVWSYKDDKGKSIDINLIPIVSEGDNGVGAYLVRGWQGLNEQNGKPMFPDFTALYVKEKEGNKLYFMAYDMKIGVQMQNGDKASLGTWGLTSDNGLLQGGALAEFTVKGGSAAALVGLSVEVTDQETGKPKTVNITKFLMGAISTTNPENGVYLMEEGVPSLPCGMTKKGKAAVSAPAAMAFSSKRISNSAYSYTSLVKDMTFIK